MRCWLLMVLALPFLAGCACDPPVERVAVKTRPHQKKVALAVAPKPSAVFGTKQPSATTAFRTMRIKRCDCPQDFDPEICGRRSAYTSWSPDCAAPPEDVSVPRQSTPASFKGPAPP
jgi:hypothetical protein